MWMETKVSIYGFNFEVVNGYLYVLKEDICIMFDQFHGNESVLKFFCLFMWC